ncbi:expressed unknown protein [Seminavis robusta]|uniref:Uncharacterized protein n=1 Tax=Seminavis robusta TaxID=568900 RepID=A0A9N8EXX8_9STRA|nr:expressed unknown protein [Seminavis robusta]|eukprot:Sro2121_g315470.1 n/a (512) ;mRNA; r:9914-11651
MFKINAFFLTLLLSQAGATPLRTDRQLSEELFISYEPQTAVTDHAAIDLDQQAIEQQLAAGTDEGRASAKDIYTNGAYSKTYAVLQLSAPLTSEVQKGVEVTGKNANGDEILGNVLDVAEEGDTTIRVQYKTSNVQATYSTCQVGASPDPVTTGCFAPSGDIKAGANDPFTYTYDVSTGNQNARTIQGFSLQAKAKMYECEKCPYDTYKKFYDYYGAFDYANQWVLAAFNNANIAFTNGGADFSKYQTEGTNEAIKKGTAYMNIWMYVIRELEDAVDDCNNNCSTDDCNDDQVHAWDEAVAFYTGSLTKQNAKEGVLLYTLAQKRCLNFGTCGDDGVAGVNTQIFNFFSAGKQHLQQGKCDDAKALVPKITSLMTIPLVQGTIRYAHIIGQESGMTEKAEAEGAVFAASVLPVLHSCNAGDASTVYNNMKVGSGANVDFAAVKKAFEDNYACMGINCADVGGMLQADGENFFAGAEPCTGGAPSNTASKSGAYETGVAVAAGISAIVAALI